MGEVPALPPGMLCQKTHELQMFPLDPNAVRSLYLCYENSHFPTFIHSVSQNHEHMDAANVLGYNS